jgi:hypothetical protein
VKLRLLVLLIVAVAATSCAAEDANLQRISYSRYGFSFSLPAGFSKMPVPVQAPDGWVEAYSNGAVAAGVGVAKAPANQSIDSGIAKLGSQLGLGRSSYLTPQGVTLVGASGIFTMTKEMAKGLPPSMPFRSGMNIKMSVYMCKLPSDASQVMVLYFGGPAEQAGDIESLTQTALGSLTFANLKGGDGSSSSSSAQSTPGGPALGKGEIALYGKVTSIKPDTKSLKMMADRVIAYGQQPVALNPAREKIVKYFDLPKDVAVGCRVIVIGKNAGTGKPMVANTIRLETTPSQAP